MKLYVTEKEIVAKSQELVVVSTLRKGTKVKLRNLTHNPEIYCHIGEVQGHGVLVFIPYLQLNDLDKEDT